MKKIRVLMVLAVGTAAISPYLHGQSTAKPSPYTGVSQPPPDDTITTDEAVAAKPSVAASANAPAPESPAGTAVATSSAPAVRTTSPAENPDYGMIGDSQPGAVPAMTVSAPQLALVADPDAGIVTFVPTRPGELPSGTLLHMALNEDISSENSQPGTDFTGRIASDVTSGGRVVIPQGSEVVGKVLRVSEGRRFGSPAMVRLRPDVVVLPDGSRYVLRAQIIDTDGKSKIDGEGALTPKSRIKTNAIKEGAGIGAGAITGGVLGGPAGAFVGSVIGAGVMTTHILVQSPAEVKVPKDANLTLSLTEPMLITPVQSN
jgi:hypothetical protein